MVSKFLSCSSTHMAAPFTKPANSRERGPGLWPGGTVGGGTRAKGRVATAFKLEASLSLQILHLSGSHT